MNDIRRCEENRERERVVVVVVAGRLSGELRPLVSS